jgi:hypothetical protein
MIASSARQLKPSVAGEKKRSAEKQKLSGHIHTRASEEGR